MLTKYKNIIHHSVLDKIKNHHKMMDSKATIILMALIIGIILTRTFSYIADSQILISEKVTDKEAATHLNLVEAHTDAENTYTNDIIDYKPMETQETASETQKIDIENDIKINGSSQDDLKSGQEYIFCASLNRYYNLNEFNEFTIEELMRISGIGEVTANAILSYRETHGSFQSFSELQEIKGIGEKKLNKWIVIGP